MSQRRRAKRVLKALAVIVLLPIVLHFAILAATSMSPPDVELAQLPAPTQASNDPTLRQLGGSYVRKRGAIHEVRLAGSSAELGQTQTTLLYPHMVHIESEMHDQFTHFVPWSAARTLIVDMARLRFRSLDDAFAPARLEEIAGQAAAFRPDPFSGLMDTYQRFVFLHSLYDIMLSFERSPLVGCTSFALTSEASENGHTLLGRNFDFEGPQVLDDEKAVFLVFEGDRIPYASVSWPGFIGVASGMNAEGLAIVIHGARAGSARASGEPVAQTVRDLLGTARSTREAVAMLGDRSPMVPHMLFIADALGDVAAAERIPGEPVYIRRRDGDRMPMTNHFEGPAANDPKNAEVKRLTSTLARRARLDEILANVAPGSSVKHAVEILRDKKGVGGTTLPLGHRSAIDALIATHSVVMDTTARELWVSEGPHATGRFVRFDLRRLLARDYRPGVPEAIVAIAADPILLDGRFEAWRAAGAAHEGVE